MRLRAEVLAGLARHGLSPVPEETSEALRARLNDLYLEDVRRLRERQRRGEIPRSEYASHVKELRRGYPLLSLPLELWKE